MLYLGIILSLLFTPTTAIEEYHKAAQTKYTSLSRTQFYIKRRFPIIQSDIPKKKIEQKISNTPWNGYFSAQNFSTKTNAGARELSSIKSTLRSSIIALPKEHSQNLQSLIVKNKYHKSRGLSNESKIILHTDLIDDSKELSAVFLHEMGHIVDLGYLKGSHGRSYFKDRKKIVHKDDPSVDFYGISWRNSTLKKQATQRKDFVSGYATTNPFEDFAESYILYRLHGEKFRLFAKKSSQLQQKYDFLKNKVFKGIEYKKTK